MAQFNLTWDNTEVNASSNTINQRVSYRQRSVGGAWLTTGFTPANDMAKTVNAATSPILTSNVAYEFKIDCLCTENGPSQNDNGIKEYIGFTCIVPDIVNTDTTSAIGVDLTDTDITKARFTLRKSSDNSIVFGPITVDRAGNMASTVATTLTASTNYYWQISLFATINGVEVNSSDVSQLNSVCGPYNITTSGAPVMDLIWVKNTSVCEKEGGFNIIKQITGLSSPSQAIYDDTTGRVYFGSNDNGGGHGNVGWLNPDTATTIADVTFSTAINMTDLYNIAVDNQYRRIYFVGANSGGLIVYDIATDTISTIAYGVNGVFSRIFLYVGDTKIYCGYSSTSVTVIDRATLAVTSTVNYSTIASPSHFNASFAMLEVSGKLYVINSNNASISTIGVYNLDFSTHYTEIVLPSCATWAAQGGYWQNISYDPTGNLIYICDIGSSRRYIIDPTTDTVIDNQQFVNREGKTNAEVFWKINPINNDLIMVYKAMNSLSDGSPITRIYIENRTTHSYFQMIENQYYSSFQRITGTNTIVGCNPGVTNWSGTAGWDTDGKVIFISTSAGTDNTGTEIITTLKEVDHNNGDLPTGNTKSNNVGDPNYIAPITNSATCPLTYTTDCPVDKASTFAGATLQYEFSLANSVKSNPAIAKIQVYAYNTNTASVEGAPVEITPAFVNYYKGSFAGLGGLNYNIQIRYLDSSNGVLQTC